MSLLSQYCIFVWRERQSLRWFACLHLYTKKKFALFTKIRCKKRHKKTASHKETVWYLLFDCFFGALFFRTFCCTYYNIWISLKSMSTFFHDFFHRYMSTFFHFWNKKIKPFLGRALSSWGALSLGANNTLLYYTLFSVKSKYFSTKNINKQHKCNTARRCH